MPAISPSKKVMSSTFRKIALNDLREDANRVGVRASDIKRRLDFIRKTHRNLTGIKPKQ